MRWRGSGALLALWGQSSSVVRLVGTSLGAAGVTGARVVSRLVVGRTAQVKARSAYAGCRAPSVIGTCLARIRLAHSGKDARIAPSR